MDAKTIAGAGLIIGGGLIGYKSMKDLAGLGCYGPAAYLTLGLTAIGGGLFLFGKLRREEISAKNEKVKEEISAVLSSEYFPQLPDDMEAGAVVVPDSYGGTSSLMSGRGVPQWYGSAEGRKYGKRDRYTDRWGNARYMTRRKDGSIVTSVNIAGKKGAVANDRRSNAVNYAKPGYRQMGDAKPVGRVERAMKNMFGADGEYTVQEQGLPVIPDSYGTNSALSSGQGVPQWYGSAEGKSKYGRRQRFTTSKGNSRYVARNSKGEFISNVAVAGKRGSIAQDLRKTAKSYKPVGYRQMGDGKRVSQKARRSKNE
tara:strand:- start:5915 stop:6853 length:939 start_codon:yes stop_codon:yes gene_type:complete